MLYYLKIQNVYNGLFCKNYRVAMLYKLYLSVIGISMQLIKPQKRSAIRINIRTDRPILAKEKLCF